MDLVTINRCSQDKHRVSEAIRNQWFFHGSLVSVCPRPWWSMVATHQGSHSRDQRLAHPVNETIDRLIYRFNWVNIAGTQDIERQDPRPVYSKIIFSKRIRCAKQSCSTLILGKPSSANRSVFFNNVPRGRVKPMFKTFVAHILLSKGLFGNIKLTWKTF